MITIIGENTGKVYAKGPEEECFRKLQKKYPSSTSGVNHRNRKGVNRVYPEPLQVIRGTT